MCGCVCACERESRATSLLVVIGRERERRERIRKSRIRHLGQNCGKEERERRNGRANNILSCVSPRRARVKPRSVTLTIIVA